jgi:DNA repair exonuclease SbcCD ATPase subunit
MFQDEPTNNLDIESIDALADAINEYNGGRNLQEILFPCNKVESPCIIP